MTQYNNTNTTAVPSLVLGMTRPPESLTASSLPRIPVDKNPRTHYPQGMGLDDEWEHDEEDEAETALIAQREATKALRAGTLNPEVEPELADPIEGPYTREELTEMQLLSMPKPPEVSWGDWIGPKKLSHRHDYFVLLAASGMTAGQLAETLGFSKGRISVLLSKSEIKREIKAKQAELWGEDSQTRFKQILTKAIDITEEILTEPTTKDSLRADIAFRFMDRAIGKPKQEVVVEGNLLADFIHRLDQKETSIPQERAVDSEEKPKDDVDEFIDEFVPENFTIGKRTGGYE